MKKYDEKNRCQDSAGPAVGSRKMPGFLFYAIEDLLPGLLQCPKALEYIMDHLFGKEDGSEGPNLPELRRYLLLLLRVEERGNLFFLLHVIEGMRTAREEQKLEGPDDVTSYFQEQKESFWNEFFEDGSLFHQHEKPKKKRSRDSRPDRKEG